MAMQSYFGGWHSAIASRKNSEVRLSRIGDATQLEGALPGYRTRSATKQMPQYRRKIFGMDLIRGSLDCIHIESRALARVSGTKCLERRVGAGVCFLVVGFLLKHDAAAFHTKLIRCELSLGIRFAKQDAILQLIAGAELN